MENKVEKLIAKLRAKYPEQLKKDPLFDALEDEVLGEEEDMLDEGEEMEGMEEEMDEDGEPMPPVDIEGIAEGEDEEDDEDEDLLF